jgi:hypothetical protein
MVHDQDPGEPEAKVQNKRFPLYAVLQSALLLIAVAALILLGLSLYKNLTPRREPVTILENKIREIQELALVRQVYRDVIYARAGGMFTSEILFSIDYHIVAGMNFSRGVAIEEKEDGSLLVRLPEPEILSIDADDNSITQYYIKESFRAVRQSDYMSLIVSEKEELTAAAIDSGILLRAKRNGELLLVRIFRLSGYETVRFEYLSAAKPSEES